MLCLWKLVKGKVFLVNCRRKKNCFIFHLSTFDVWCGGGTWMSPQKHVFCFALLVYIKLIKSYINNTITVKTWDTRYAMNFKRSCSGQQRVAEQQASQQPLANSSVIYLTTYCVSKLIDLKPILLLYKLIAEKRDFTLFSVPCWFYVTL